MATLYLIHGFVGTGKTTFSKNLEKETRSIRFTPDEWMCELYGKNPPKEYFREYEERIKNIIKSLSFELLESGISVIWDYGFWSRKSRDEACAWAKSINVDIKIYALVCPENILRQRVKQRTAQNVDGEVFIDDNAITEFLSFFEPINPKEEDCIIINT